mmetsp:Transcript_100155/g.188692  ORF Transcript_100155/g.188692 Transcript_100155/m.188692 type:complete len:443 (-) Transcript_100155:21-1349(-)
MLYKLTRAVVECLDDGWTVTLGFCLLAALVLAWPIRRHKEKDEEATNFLGWPRQKPQPDSQPSFLSHGQSRTKHQWQIAQYGLYKYCGLHDFPLSQVEHPVYNFREAPPMKLPELTHEETQKISALRSAVSDLPREEVRLDVNTLYRFLLARKGNVQKAEKLFREAHRQYVKYRFDKLFQDPVIQSCAEALMPWYHSGGFIGHSLEGYPVAMERFGWGRFHELCNTLPFDLLLKLDHLHTFRGLAVLEQDAARRGTEFKRGVLVVDMKGLSLDVLRPVVLQTYRKLIKFRDTATPEMGKLVLVVRAPALFASAFNKVKQIALTEETAAKVQMATSANSLALLRKYLPDSVIPAYLGGTLRVDGDPECRRMIAPGGPVPKEIIDQVLQKYYGSKSSEEVCSHEFAATDEDELQGVSRGQGQAPPCEDVSSSFQLACCCTARQR